MTNGRITPSGQIKPGGEAAADFDLTIEGTELNFRTSAYKAEKGSVLSPVMYSHELSAMLASAVPAAALFLLSGKTGTMRYLAALAAYAAGFLFFRAFVFKKRYLLFDISKKSGMARLCTPFRAKKTFGTEEIEKVEAEKSAFLPENPEGLKQVEKIALHHHTVLPELDKPVDFYCVRVWLKNSSSFVIYAGRTPAAAADITLKIKEFLSTQNA
ncbi:MAG: hypothetical protein M0Z75_06160 [Nitrospiraceae bacterium]|nr:hypothetical protein [Nitrospiraceae bacterium]